MSKRSILMVGALLSAVVVTMGQSNLSILSFATNGVLSFREITNATGYRVEWSTNLAQPSWRTSSPPGVVGIPAAGFGTRTVTVGVAQAASIYRVVATVTNRPSSNRPRGSYYINFQDLSGSPSAPVIVDGKTYTQVGWKTAAGSWMDYIPGRIPFYGWLRDSANQQFSGYYADPGNYSVLERSYVFDDYGRRNIFVFELESGRYLVTVGVGRPPRGGGDPHNILVEGQALFNDVVLTNVQARAIEIQLTDGVLSLEFGGRSPSTGVYGINYLAYMKVEPVN
jgi:hypothetical protein